MVQHKRPMTNSGTPGSFDLAIRAFSYCNEAQIRCGVRVTLTKENYHELKDLIDLSLQLGAYRFCVY
ncbi:MAG TPA: hypothetical protein VN429_04515 [Methanospirillum sp.]|uniref:hypothetical protein n=1 Tax=Methanospirillum sp. TaxID=45200 RepID=UPI002CEEE16F|nr:hypothetical protein [Methanospirillum sp.]HWQ63659.1 hypothetical protein [Methanospirillum sp.]